MSTTDQLMRVTPAMLEHIHNANDPNYEGRHRTTDHIPTMKISADRVARALNPQPKPAPLMSRLVSWLREAGR